MSRKSESLRNRSAFNRVAAHWRAALFAVFAAHLAMVGSLHGQAERKEAQAAEAPEIPADQALPAVAEGAESVYLVRLGLPLRGAAADSALQTLTRITGEAARNGTAQTTVVLEFRATPNRAEEGSVYEDCLKIARFLTGEETRRLRTIAWLPRAGEGEGVRVKGHAVLTVLACQELIVDASAELGEAGIAGRIDPDMRRTYEEIAGRRLTLPPAVAVAMLDKEVTLSRVTQLEQRGDSYVLDEEFQKIQQAGQVLESETLKSPGALAKFNGSELSQRHFATRLAGDLNELADALNVPTTAFDFGASLDGSWYPVRVDLRGPLSHTEVERVKRSLADRIATGDKLNLVCLWIDSGGGSLPHSVEMARFLMDSFDASKVRTVAYVPRAARSDAAIVALACDQVVMHEGAVLGGPGDGDYNARELEDFSRAVADLAGKKGRPRSVLRALVDSQLSVSRCTKAGSTVPHFLTDEEFDDLPNAQEWQKGRELGTADGLDTHEAGELGILAGVVANYDEFLQLFHLPAEIEVLEPNWAHSLVGALATPGMAGFLLFIGFIMLFVEAKTPGIGVPAFLSSVCFLLFFWSRFLNGTAGWLEVLLFLAGLFFIAIELFVLPGFGIFGLGGGVMVLTSIVLASQTFVLPRNSYQLEKFSVSLGTLTLTLGAVGLALVLLRKHLKRAPLVNRVMLEPGGGVSAPELSRREALVELSHLVGKRGLTTTLLAPSGQARIGDLLVDVSSDGELIARGEEVVVQEVQGSRVLVRRVAE